VDSKTRGWSLDCDTRAGVWIEMDMHMALSAQLMLATNIQALFYLLGKLNLI
jgi:hypothetical protein